MSRIGNQPVSLKEGLQAVMKDNELSVTGPKGTLFVPIPEGISLEVGKDAILISRKNDKRETKALHGTVRALIANMVGGVSDGWSKELEVIGTGYRAEVKNGDLELTVGFSHPVVIKKEEGIEFKVEKNVVSVEGADRQLVGQIAAKIRAVRPPEPYKGKGIKYLKEEIRRKPGKAAKTQTEAA